MTKFLNDSTSLKGCNVHNHGWNPRIRIQSACTSTGRNHGYNPRLWIVNPSGVVIHVTTPLITSLKGCNVHNHGWNPWRDDAIRGEGM